MCLRVSPVVIHGVTASQLCDALIAKGLRFLLAAIYSSIASHLCAGHITSVNSSVSTSNNREAVAP